MSRTEAQHTVRLGSSGVALSYPRDLEIWFNCSGAPGDEGISQRQWVRLSAHAEPNRFDLTASVGPSRRGLELGDAVAAVWERVSFLAIADLCDAFALHAAAVCLDGSFVLLPGRTGAGKTSLSLWYHAQGFAIATDEVVSISTSDGAPVWTALDRPLMLKSGASAPSVRPLASQREGSGGLILRLPSANPCGSIDRGIIVFPQFTKGVPLELSVLTPGEAGLRLMDNCLNARNLASGGLPIAGLLARRLPALALSYGHTAQLDGVLDVLTRHAIGAPRSGDLGALCLAFTAKAALRTVGASVTPDQRPEVGAPAPTAARFARRLTIGMATYDDYDGAYFTIQSIRMGNPELEGAVEFVVIDNNPGGACSEGLSRLGAWVDGYRYVPRGDWSGTAIRDAVFQEAHSPFVLCIDSHVLIAPGAIARLISLLEADPDSCDLFQGPMLYDDLRQMATHMDPCWRGGMYGTWGSDPRGVDPSLPCFDIPMHGLGLFACRRAAWPGFNPSFRGFGGEEGYIHEKIRQRGGRTLCLPFLKWTHRFTRPRGTTYANRWKDRMRNYVIGFTELGLDTTEMEAHFHALLGVETATRIFAELKQELA